MLKSVIASAGSLLVMCGVAGAAEVTWSVFADQTAMSSPGSESRSLRAIAVNPQSTILFGSYINGSSSHVVKAYDATAGSPSYGSVTGSFATSTGTAAAKAIAVDDRGYIYTGRPDDDTAQIRIFDNTFNRLNSADVPLDDFGHDKRVNGIDVVHSGSQYFVYTTSSSSSTGWVNRWDVTNPAAPVLDTSFGINGRIDLNTITGASSATYLRGIDVAADGVIFTASLDSGKVHRISADLSVAVSADIAMAHDVALYGDRLYVATYNGADSRVYVLDADTLATIDVLDPVAALGLTRSSDGGFSGIDIDANGLLYVSDQVYASDSSTVSDRIFVALVPEPAALAVLGLAPVLMGRRRVTR